MWGLFFCCVYINIHACKPKTGAVPIVPRSFVCICVCSCVCVYVCTHIYIRICLYIHTCNLKTGAVPIVPRSFGNWRAARCHRTCAGAPCQNTPRESPSVGLYMRKYIHTYIELARVPHVKIHHARALLSICICVIIYTHT